MDKIPASIAERSLLCNKALEQYILDTSAFPNEHEQLKELREATIEKYKQKSIMNTMPDEAQFLSMLLKLMNAKNTLEIGVFTGYSLLITALTLPKDGKVVGIDPFKEAYEVGLPFIKKAGVEHKIEFVQEKASVVLDDLLNQGKEGAFDFAFVDADKENYLKYHEQLLKLVKVGGIIAYDNTLWLGSVAYADDDEIFKTDSVMKYLYNYGRVPLQNLNTFLASDPRIESTLLSIGDGLTLCRRKY